MALTTQQQTDLFKLGVGMYNASLGLTYASELAAAVEAGMSIEAIYNALANSTGFQTLNSGFSSFATNNQFATAFTDQLTGTTLAAADRTWVIDYIETQLNSGRSRGSVMKELVDALDAIPSTHATLGNAAARFDNRVEVSRTYTLTQNGTATSISTLQNTIANVDQTQASVEAAVAANAGASGQTFTLTTGVDTLTGTSGGDTFSAIVDGTTAANTTIAASDTVNGGAGTDVLSLLYQGAAVAGIPAASISNVETVNIRAIGTGAVTAVDLSAISGVTAINSDRSTQDVTATGLASGGSVGVIGNGTVTNGAVTVSYVDAATAATLNISNGTVAGNGSDITINGAGLTSATINSTGGANIVDGIALAGTVTAVTINASSNLTVGAGDSTGITGVGANTTITVSGAATSVNLDTLDNNVKSVDATGMTAGGVTLTTGTGTTSVKGGAGVDSVTANVATATYDLGAGNDTLTLGTTVLTTGTAVGGDGTDVLAISDQAAWTADTVKQISGFETLRLNDDNDGALDTFDVSRLSSITAIQIGPQSAGDGVSLTNVSAALASAINIRGSQAVGPTIAVTGASTVGQIDTLAFTVADNSSTKNTLTVADVFAAGVENVSFALTDNLTLSAMTGLTAMTGATVTGSGNANLSTGALALNVNTTIDASALTGTFTFSGATATANGLAIKGSATKANTITGTAQSDSITGGTGVDTITSTTGTDTVDLVSDSSADSFIQATLTGKTTISNFDVGTTTTTEDIYNVAHDDLDGTEVVITAAAAQGTLGDDRTIVIEQTVGAAASLTTGGTATLAAADFTAGTLTNLATFLNERFTADNADTTAGNQTALIVLNNGTNTYAYVFSDSATQNATIEAAELTLVGVFNGAVLNAGDVTQTV